MAFAIKARISDSQAGTFVFAAQKTMYGGKHIAPGDTIFLFGNEDDGRAGLIARGIVTAAESIERRIGLARQAPRVTLAVRRTAPAIRPLGRAELKPFADWTDGRPNKIVGLSDEAAAFLSGYF